MRKPPSDDPKVEAHREANRAYDRRRKAEANAAARSDESNNIIYQGLWSKLFEIKALIETQLKELTAQVNGVRLELRALEKAVRKDKQ